MKLSELHFSFPHFLAPRPQRFIPITLERSLYPFQFDIPTLTTMTPLTRSHWILLSTTLASSSTSFLVAPALTAIHLETSIQQQQPTITTTTTSRRALIYGWDDGDDDDGKPVETSFRYETELAQCSTEGMSVAESIAVDPDRLGSLARLAVAFSPPERALQLDQIERVDILCVSQKHIDIQAVICEDGGCVSLAVPIQFPKACDVGAHLEGCVISHLEDFDESASTVLAAAQQSKNTDDDSAPLDITGPIDEYPSWWEFPTSPSMVSECNNMCSILNEAEFQPEILALVKDAMRKDGEGLIPTVAKVARLGPAGFCFKVRAKIESPKVVRTLDVFSPFGGASKATVDELRAAVLGTVATAGGEPA